MSQNKLLEDGRQKVKLRLSKQKVVTEDIKKKKNQKIKLVKKSYTQESQVQNKKKISVDKQISSKRFIPDTNSLQMLVQASITPEKDLKPFWNNSSKTISQKLWLPTKTDGQDLDSKCLNGFSNSTEQSCWFVKTNLKHQNKNWQKTSCLLQRFSHPDIMDQENIKSPKKSVAYTRKIRIYPNKTQKKLFEKCFGTHRFFYNKTVNYINKNSGVQLYLSKVRPHVMNSDKNLKPDELWQKEIPNDTRQQAIDEAISSFKSAHALLEKGLIKFFKVSYKSKKAPTSHFHITKKALHPTFHLFKRRLKKKLRVRNKMKKWIEKNINIIDHQCIIVKEKPNRYFVCIPCDKKKEIIKRPYNIVSLDPGVKTFQTFYSPDGICGKLGDKITKPLSKINKIVNKLKSKIAEETGRTKINIKKRCFLLRTKIKNKVKDLHWKTASYLCKNFENILIPSFETSKMASKKNRKINKKTTNEMLSLSHYKFRERLIFKSKCYSNCNVYVCREDYTSKTCTNCGNMQKSLGGKRIYKCNKCKMVLDRDLNGARNILLKVLSSNSNRSDPTGAFISEI